MSQKQQNRVVWTFFPVNLIELNKGCNADLNGRDTAGIVLRGVNIVVQITIARVLKPDGPVAPGFLIAQLHALAEAGWLGADRRSGHVKNWAVPNQMAVPAGRTTECHFVKCVRAT